MLALSLSLGSWLGLGRPDAEKSKTSLAEARSQLDRLLTRAAPTPPSKDGKKEEERAIEVTPPKDTGGRPNIDPNEVASVRAWPELNPEASIERGFVVAEGPMHEPGDNHRLVTLTFDDGPFIETTPVVLKMLAYYKLHATFFVVGQYLQGETRRDITTRKLLKRIAAEGHLIGNHTMDHSRLTVASHTRVLSQIDDGAAAIEKVTGKRPVLFRPPFGELDDFSRAAVKERGLDVVLWSVEVNDMQRSDPHQMFKELKAQIDHKEGGIVLLHDIRKTSVAALRELLEWLRDHKWDPSRPERVGYEVVDLPTYLKAVAANPQPFETREELSKAREQRRAQAVANTLRAHARKKD